MTRRAAATDPIAPVRALLDQLNLTTAARRLDERSPPPAVRATSDLGKPRGSRRTCTRSTRSSSGTATTENIA
jgi:hypothetical protein